MGINLCKKGILGMPLDRVSYPLLIEKILDLFCNTFGANMIFVKKQEVIEHMGYFLIQYRYLPLGYDIIFISERDVFCIDICDDEGAKNSLYRIEKFNTETKIENVKDAIKKLQSILLENNFAFYITRGGKLYMKRNGQYKRVKALTQLVGGNIDGAKKL